MHLFAQVLIVFVALLHLYFLALEMFFWDKPLGRKVVNLTSEFATASKSLAANQGLYNGFLAAGLIWSLVLGGHEGFHAAIFFLTCVIVAGMVERGPPLYELAVLRLGEAVQDKIFVNGFDGAR